MAVLPNLIIVLGVLVILVRAGWNVGNALLSASILLGLLFGLSPDRILNVFTETIVSWEANSLYLVVAGITFMGSLLYSLGKMGKIMSGIEGLVGDLRLVAAGAPAFIGLLPMPGGAMMSAPMVKSVNDRLGLSPQRETAINYWFRHIWEYCSPVYPSVILSASILEIEAFRLAFMNTVFTVIAVLAGYVLLIRPVEKGDRPKIQRSVSGLLGSAWPVLVVIVGYVGLGVDLLAMTAATTLLVGIAYRPDKKQAVESLKRSKPLRMYILIYSIMAFKAMLSVSGAVETLPDTLLGANIPVFAILFFIPLIVSLLTGLTIAGIGAALPVLTGFIGTGVNADLNLLLAAYMGAYLGVLLSPVHLCLVLTREYYGASWGKLYPLILKLVLTMFAATLLLYASGYPWTIL